MHHWKEMATLPPLPASCISTHMPSFDQEELINTGAPLSATSLTFDSGELPFNVDEIIMQGNHKPYDGTATCSNMEEQLMLAATPNYVITDDYWHDYNFARHDHATHVQDDVGADMEYSLNMWENWLEATSQSQTLNKIATPSSCMSISPGYLSGETSPIFPAELDTSLIDSSPVYYGASPFDANQHDSHNLYVNNPVNEHFDINLGMQSNPTNYVRSTFLPRYVYGNVLVTHSGSTASSTATSDDDFFDTGASSFAALVSPPPHVLNFDMAGASRLSQNLEASASQPQLNLEARSSLFHQNLEASYHNINAARAIRNSSNRGARQSGEAVSILVESRMPAIDDGHVWRKYGQKNIKDKIHPRSYFRCAQPDCPIKKQTESSTEKEGFLLITYFGKHNH